MISLSDLQASIKSGDKKAKERLDNIIQLFECGFGETNYRDSAYNVMANFLKSGKLELELIPIEKNIEALQRLTPISSISIKPSDEPIYPNDKKITISGNSNIEQLLSIFAEAAIFEYKRQDLGKINEVLEDVTQCQEHLIDIMTEAGALPKSKRIILEKDFTKFITDSVSKQLSENSKKLER